jgi:hypothetical protein
MKAQKRSRGIAPPFLQLRHYGIGWLTVLPGRFTSTPGNGPIPIVYEAGWAPGPVWTSPEYLAFTGFRTPERPARSRSLYRLRYPRIYKGMIFSVKPGGT